MGLHRAFPDAEIVGVDIRPQKNYPFTFIQGDALEFDLSGFDFVWASPPCQEHTSLRTLARRAGLPIPEHHVDIVGPMRTKLHEWGGLWIMENVVGAPLTTQVVLCGSMFGLNVRRHRLFEAPFLILQPGCRHDLQTSRFRSLDKRRQQQPASVVGVHGHINYSGESEIRKQAMEIDWMTDYELTQAIPPAYSQYLAQFIPLPAARAA